MRAAMLWLLVGWCVIAAGCRDRQGDAPSTGGQATAWVGGSGEMVQFPAGNGVVIAARLHGRTVTNGLVLVGDPALAPAALDELAARLAGEGYLALTVAFPGQGGSTAVNGLAIVQAAAAFLRGRGVEHVALLGEGAGGALALAAAEGVPVRGAAALSPPSAYRGPLGDVDAVAAIARLDMPVLVLGSLADADQVTEARRLYDAARDPKTLALKPGPGRGAELLRGADASTVQDVLREFLREVFAPLSA